MIAWLRKPRIAFSLALVSLFAALGFLGPRLGLPSREHRLLAMLTLLLLVLAFLLLKARSKGPSAAVTPPVEPPTRKTAQEVEAVQNQVKEAIKTLKTSHLGRTKGRAALYELPWFLVMGHGDAGKSRIIRHAGLTFPLSRERVSSDLDLCQWCFATEAVLLDTQGRLLDGPDHQPGWMAFLKQLQVHRPGGPLEGILVAVDIRDLLAPQAGVPRAHAIRHRLSDVEQALGMKIPVYLVFTKMDLLPGFTAFFEDQTKAETRDVWGTTLAHDQSRQDPAGCIQEELFWLQQGLTHLGSSKLARNRNSEGRPEWSTFPMLFRNLGTAVRTFIQELMGNDPYHGRPLLRGFYFTSALQTQDPDSSAPARSPSLKDDSRPYFLEDLFRQVIFQDRFLASNLGAPRRHRTRLAWMGAGLALLALLSGAGTWSFVGNRKLVADTREDLAQARELWASAQLEDRLKALVVIQFRLEQLGRHRVAGRPRALGLGLYQGRDLELMLRRRYFGSVAELMLAPVKENLEAALAKCAPAPASRRPKPARKPRRKRPLPTEGSILRVAHLTSRRSFRPPQPRPVPRSPAAPGAEATYNALRTYLMLNDRSRMEALHLADQLPRYWRPYLAAQASGNVDLQAMATKTIAFYVSQISEPDLPLIDNRPDLVALARKHLRGQTRLLSPLEQIYSELKARGNSGFDPMTVGRILKNRDLDLMAPGHAVPGSFTREAYEGFFRAAIREAAKGSHGPDWVLAAPRNPHQAGTPEDAQAVLEALYKADYEKEWDTFLQSVTVLDFGDLGGASAGLGRLGDPQHSPLKLILARAAQETAWDNPSLVDKALDKTLDKLKSKVLTRTDQLLGNQVPAGPRYGPMGSYFSALSILATPGEGGTMPIDGYLQLLQKARTRLGAMALSADPCASAREYLQGTLLGTGSELAETQLYVETILLARVDGHGRDLLRPMLLRPLTQAFTALLPAAEQDINRAWTQQVLSPWHILAARYPFSDSRQEATLADIAKFLKPVEGTLHRFLEKHLGPLVSLQGDRLVPRTWGGHAPGFSEAFLQDVARLCSASATLQEGTATRFEVQPVPTPGMREIVLEIDGQKLAYRNGPQTWTAFSWPGETSHQGARIQLVAQDGATAQVHNAPGRLGFLRLVEQAWTDAPAAPEHALEWTFRPTDRGPEALEPCRVRVNFRMVSGPDPLRFLALRHHTLPARATH